MKNFVLFVLLILSAISILTQLSCTKTEIAAEETPKPEKVVETPKTGSVQRVLVKNKIVDINTGEIITEIPLIRPDYDAEFAFPISENKYKLTTDLYSKYYSEVDVDTRTNQKKNTDEVKIAGNKLQFINDKEELIWKIEKSVVNFPEWKAFTQENVVIIYNKHGLVVLDARTGSFLWEVQPDSNRYLELKPKDSLLLILFHNDNEINLEGRKINNGEIQFNLQIPPSKDVNFIDVSPELICITGSDDINLTYFIDLSGKILLELNKYTYKALYKDGFYYVITDYGFEKLDKTGKTIWKQLLGDWTLRFNNLISIDEDIYIYWFCPISDSGIYVYKINLNNGHNIWEKYLSRLGIDHEEYLHFVYMIIQQDSLIFVSQGSYGSFIEIIDKETSTTIKRILVDN